MALFGASVAVLLTFIYWSTAGYIALQTDDTIEAEVTGLAERYSVSGLDGLVRSIDERVSRKPNGDAVYLLTDDQLTRLIGNLDRWPRVSRDSDGWLNFNLEQTTSDGQVTHRARARPFMLRGGYRLLVGRDMHELDATRSLIVRAIAWGLAITVMMALAGGTMLSRRTMRRLEAINETSRRIMRGDLSRRIPTRSTDDDFDQLADNLNGMLDTIEKLMEDVRRVTDNVAHDLRTPLSRLRNRLEDLKSDKNADTSRIEAALADADGLLATFNALLRIASIESGRRRAAFESIALDDVVRDVAELYEPLAEEKEQNLDVRVSENVRVRGDRDLLFQAFANLLDNAIKYTPRGGDIRVTLDEDSSGPRIRIIDSGPGIPEHSREQVFKRFFRLEESRNTPGNGLGLSLVEAVVRLHHADITLGGEPGLDVSLAFPKAA
ncbi:MAG: HAMP domain-containing histidine kinase [Lysobacterales bacterium]|nr:MAG: HAMP domain-containing histidine kinase [Xanthomonadales bacterium]